MQAFEVESAADSQDATSSRSPQSAKTFKSVKSRIVSKQSTHSNAQKWEVPELDNLSRVGYISIFTGLFFLFLYFANIKGGERPPPPLVVSPRLKEIAKEIFEIYDDEHDEHIDNAELLEALSLLGIQYTQDEMQKSINKFGGNPELGLRMPEFFRMLASLQISASKRDLKFTFALLDRGRTNKISAAELYKVAEDVGSNSTLVEMNKVLQEFGEEDGRLSFDEFLSLVSAVMGRSSHIARVLQRVLSDMNMIVFFNRGLRKGGLVMVDATTEASRLYSYNDYGDKSQIDIKTDCSDGGDHPLHGVAAITYDQHECKVQLETTFYDEETYGLDPDDKLTITRDEQRPRLAIKMLQNLRAMHEHNPRCIKNVSGNCAEANNKKTIPIMGSASMRLMPWTSNILMWNTLCGAKDPTGSYKFAKRGRKCGTMPGTDEAWYEFIANVGQGVSRRHTATIRVGFHSTQIAVPLLTSKEKEAFQEVMTAVKEILGDCGGLTLPNSESLVPIFNSAVFEDANECYRDFVDMRDTSEMNLAKEDQEVGGLLKVKAIGLISFLGVGSGSIAGGIDSIEVWAAANDCGAADSGEEDSEYDYDGCKEKLDEALQEDWLFSNVKKFFDETPLIIRDYSLHTPKAMRAKEFLEETSAVKLDAEEGEDVAPGENRNIGEELLERVQTRCTNDLKNSRWGKDSVMTCMRATYIGLLLSSVFENKDLSKRIFFSPVSWVAGMYHDMLGYKEGEKLAEKKAKRQVVTGDGGAQSV